MEAYTLAGPQDDVLALWLPGRPHDACDGVPVDIWVGLPTARVSAYEPLDGLTQSLRAEPHNGGTLVRATGPRLPAVAAGAEVKRRAAYPCR